MPALSPSLSPRRRRASVTVLALALGGVLATGAMVPAASADDGDERDSRSRKAAGLTLSVLGRYETGVFDASAAEIVTYHADSERLFVVNAQAGAVDVLDAANPADPTKIFDLTAEGITADDGSVIPAGTTANSVAVREDGLGAIAIESDVKTDAGWLVFFDANADEAAVLGAVRVGALPDMVSISADGRYAVVANEGEPNEDFTVDPEGSVSIVTLPKRVTAPEQSVVRAADFHAFEAGGGKTLPEDVRVFGPRLGANPVSANLEPEYVAIDAGSAVAYVALQEANAVAVVSLADADITEIWPLGFKNHGLDGNGIDASDRDPKGAPTLNIESYEGLKGMYMPDGITAYTADDETYLVTANEGDAREWGDYAEGARVKDLGADGLLPICADSPLAGLTGDADLGRLNVTTENGLNEAGTCYEELYAFGARSFSIWTTGGEQVFDSGQQLEEITAAANPDFFNSNHSVSNLEGRSDDKGPEPENLAIGEIDGRSYAFIGLERVGGIMAYDITDPASATFVTYINNRDFSVSMEESVEAGTGAADLSRAGDLGPEGLAFISAKDSPSGKPMLAVGNEVSGTTTLFAIAAEGKKRDRSADKDRDDDGHSDRGDSGR
ncbi:choice-of-anchor I family protein [Cryobacterium fucosi]|uniref:choice-of-anchor I family protein n=1 Tax=Cryobacterium fucosi TaxID=1259157 RepID=UPI0015825631|nr:choice-of-anchor I family protein [Cryobacterium fucosi]